MQWAERTMSLKQIAIAAVATMSLASFGCKEAGGDGEAIAQLTKLKDEMCACPDKACTDKVSEEMTRWGQELARAGGDKEVTRSGDATRQLQAITRDLIACEAKVVKAAAGVAAGTGGGSAAVGSAGVTTATSTGGGTAGAGSAGGGSAAAGSAGGGSAAAGSRPAPR